MYLTLVVIIKVPKLFIKLCKKNIYVFQFA